MGAFGTRWISKISNASRFSADGPAYQPASPSARRQQRRRIGNIGNEHKADEQKGQAETQCIKPAEELCVIARMGFLEVLRGADGIADQTCAALNAAQAGVQIIGIALVAVHVVLWVGKWAIGLAAKAMAY